MIEYKQFIIIPKKAKMSPGKIASQAVHASFMALEKQRAIERRDSSNETNIEKWKENGQCVIVLECEDQEQLMSAAKYLEQWNIPHHLYIDEGMTEVLPLTPTALATGILDKNHWWMLSQFKLYGYKKNYFKK